MMKILFVTGFNLTHVGGGETWLREVASCLKSNHKVTILSSSLGKTTSSVIDEVTIHEYEPLKFLRRLNLSKASRIGSTLPAFQYGSTFRKVFEDADVVYAVYFPDLQLASLYFQFSTGTPVVLGHHTALDRLKFDQSQAARLAYKFLVPTNLRLEAKFSAHHVLNDRELKGLLGYGAKNIFKIPNGVHTDNYKPREKFETFTILFLGRLEYQKGVDFLPKIVEMLNTRIDDYRLYIIGNGSLSNVVRSIHSKRVIWLGYVPENLKIEYLPRSHVLLSPSRHEAFMITGLEALASGTPVVAFDIPGPREFVINGFNGFLAKTISEMCNKIQDLYRMCCNGTYGELAKNARASSRNFDWKLIIPKIEQMLERVRDL